jgi:hypothetical protein
MNVKERIIKFIKFKGISIRSFEKTVGLSYGYINNIRVSIQPSKIKLIEDKFPDLNMSWLLLGEGEMLKRENEAEKVFNEFSENALSFLRNKADNAIETDLKNMNVGDLLILQMLERIKKLEVVVGRLESEIKEIKKGR